MSLKILMFLKALIPSKKIAAFISGVLIVVVGGLMNVDREALKAQICASELPVIPKIEVPAPAPVVEKPAAK